MIYGYVLAFIGGIIWGMLLLVFAWRSQEAQYIAQVSRLAARVGELERENVERKRQVADLRIALWNSLQAEERARERSNTSV